MWEAVQTSIWPILTTIGTLVVGGGVVTSLAYGLFKMFGEKWLNHKFDERLAAFRHEQDKELERVKFEINKLLDRSAKLHQWEFEVLPKAWTLLAKSYHVVRDVTSAMQSYPDLNLMGTLQLQEFISRASLENWQKEELNNASDKTKYYQDAIFWHRLNAARSATRKSAVYIDENGLFMSANMKQRFDRINELGWNALIEHETNHVHDLMPRVFTERDRFKNEGEALFNQLETEIRKRLWE